LYQAQSIDYKCKAACPERSGQAALYFISIFSGLPVHTFPSGGINCQTPNESAVNGVNDGENCPKLHPRRSRKNPNNRLRKTKPPIA